MSAHLRRHLAPISERAWEAIEDEARQHLRSYLAGRRLVDFRGPHGWAASATDLGRTERLEPVGSVERRERRVLPMVELRVRFALRRDELDDIDRGALDLDLGDLDRAAREIGLAETTIILEEIGNRTSHQPLELGADFGRYPGVVASAVNRLRLVGVEGPYALALSPDAYTGVVETTEDGGLVVLDHLSKVLGGPVVWAPGCTGALVVSLRGGDFLLDVGEDLSIGYLDHDADTVRLYLEETLTFRVASDDAAVPLR